MAAIELKQVSKCFGENKALDGVNLSFGGNKIYGLLGRNGAGKSTMLNLITNRLFATEGEVLIDGEKAMENDRVLGKVFCMSEKNLYADNLHVRQGFYWTKCFYPDFDMEYAKELAAKFGLNIKQKIKSLSTGYASIFKLILALSCNTPYILLDEPVLGLDANHRELFYRELVSRYSEHPSTIVISTHLIEEIADIIEQVVIIKNGSILLNRPVEEVRNMGYSVSGKREDVDRFCEGKETIGEDVLGGLKTACIMGTPENVPANLEVTMLDLQKLFVQLTNA